ncbi:MAG TPA: prepilin-type N-terminal cleavage/methylation domain-containing protein [Candidatus Nanopelagicales bacterium]|nr:prepilin-type N-terminal cleavage/methylation domain-containing protein [Candidatus Nanopelagicales bacterium]
MRAIKRYNNRAFTLVELMIVVAIIGVLAALAIYGVRRYMASAKTSEAKNTVGAISRAAAAAYERENAASEILAVGGTSTGTNHQLCNAAPAPVPAAVPAGTKFQPAETDWGGADELEGWRCLKFSMTQPVYYQYHYTRGAYPGGLTGAPPALTADGFAATALGDLDGDAVLSGFSRGGNVDAATRTLALATQVYIVEEYE